MRDRIINGGIAALRDHELLEYLLYPFIPRKDTNPLAHELIARFGSFAGVLSAGMTELSEVPGMTSNASLFLSHIMEIDERCRHSYAWNARFPDSYSVAQYATHDAGVAGLWEVARGNENSVTMSAKSLIRAALDKDAKMLYILHNHLEDRARPSKDDAEFTARVVDLFKGSGIEVKDHLIVGRKQVFSFAFNFMLNGKHR